MSQQHVDIVSQFIDRVLAGDLVGTLELLHPEMVLNEGSSLPWGGDHRGRDGFTQLFATIAGRYDFSVEHCDVIDAGDVAVCRMQVTFVNRTTGRRVTMPVVELYEVRDGLLWRGDVYYKDSKAIADAEAEALAVTG